MPKIVLRESFEMETRNKYTKVNCELAMSVDGRELPTMAVIGAAVEEAIQLIESRVKEAYVEVPPRNVDQTGITNHPLPGAIPEPVKTQPVQAVPDPEPVAKPVQVNTNVWDR